MWRPNNAQWAVIGLAVALLNAMAFNGRSVLFQGALVALDAALVVWWMEGRKRMSEPERAANCRTALYVIGAFACGALTAALLGTGDASSSAESAGVWFGHAAGRLLIGLVLAVSVRKIRRSSAAASIPQWMFWCSVFFFAMHSLTRLSELSHRRDLAQLQQNSEANVTAGRRQSVSSPYDYIKHARAVGQAEFDRRYTEGVRKQVAVWFSIEPGASDPDGFDLSPVEFTRIRRTHRASGSRSAESSR
jgi:hypothetical protein